MKRLKLRREAIRVLTTERLSFVAGGYKSTEGYCTLVAGCLPSQNPLTCIPD